MNWLLLGNTLLVALTTTLLAGAFGLAASLWQAGLPQRWRFLVLTLAIVSLTFPPFLVTNCWMDLLGQTSPWQRWIPIRIFSLPGAVWVLSLTLWPITFLFTATAWRDLKSAQLESDPALRGLTMVRVLFWPLLRTPLSAGALLTFILALNNFAVPAILQVKVFPAEMWIRFNTTFETAKALQLSWPLILLPLLMLTAFSARKSWLNQFMLSARKRRELIPPPQFSERQSSVGAPPELVRRQIGRAWFWACGCLTGIVCVLSLFLPLVQLTGRERTWTELPGALGAGGHAVWNSTFFAALTASIVMGIGLTLAVQRQLSGRFPRPLCLGAFNYVVWIPFLLPGVLLGIGLIHAFNHPWTIRFYQSFGIVILAFALRYAGMGWYSLRYTVQTVDRELLEDARLNGASPWQLFWHVQWPQIGRYAAISWYIIFLLCLWDVESIVLVVPPGGETLALRIFNLLHYGHNTQVNALCLTLLGIALAPLILWKLAELPRNRWKVQRTWIFSSLKWVLVPAAACSLFCAGCGRPQAMDSALTSRFFSRAEMIGTRGVGIGQLNKPRSVAVDAANNLYVVDMTGRVQKFSPQGVYLRSWQMPQTDLGKPKGMTRDHDGNIIVLEPHYQRVNHFTPEGILVAQWGGKGTNAGQFTLPRAVAVNSFGEIYVSEYGLLERVQRFAPTVVRSANPSNDQATTSQVVSLSLLNSFGHAGLGPGEFNRPEGLCIDAQDRVYVADSCNHRIQIFSREGNFLSAYGRPGTGLGELSYPYDVCVDAAGRQYVCEFGNSRIQIFDANNQPVEIIGSAGIDPGQFNNPWGLALDSAGNLYVADSLNHRVQKLLRRVQVAQRE